MNLRAEPAAVVLFCYRDPDVGPHLTKRCSQPLAVSENYNGEIRK